MSIIKKRILPVVAVIIICFSIMVVPAAAATPATVNEFFFTPDTFTAFIDGYDSYMIYVYSSNWYIIWFNEADAVNFKVASNGTKNIKVDGMDGSPYYRFDSSTDCFTYAAFNSGGRDLESLPNQKRVVGTDASTCGIAKTSTIITNSPTLSQKLSDFGYPPESGYHFYFDGTDSKHYCVVTLSVEETSEALTIIAPFDNPPHYNSGLAAILYNGLNSGQFYCFYSATSDDARNFLVTMDPQYVTSVKKTDYVAGVVEFHYASYDIVDQLTGKVHFAANDLSNDIAHVSADRQSRLNLIQSKIPELLKSFEELPLWLDWMPRPFASLISSSITIIISLLVAIAILKAVDMLPFT